jgi:hypothetical protein
MRQIGAGQKIHLLITPEVHSLIRSQIKLCGKTYSSHFSSNISEKSRVLIDVTSWLILRGVRSEEGQHRMLCFQSLQNIWRKKALTSLLLAHAQPSLSRQCHAYLQQCVDTFVDRIDHMIDVTVPQERSDTDKLTDLVSKFDVFLDPNDDLDVSTIFGRAASFEGKEILSSRKSSKDEIDNMDVLQAYHSEQIAEQEQEEEDEEEKEMEEEEEEEVEEEVEEEAVSRPYSRANENLVPWELNLLGIPSAVDHPSAIANAFYPLSKFAVHTSIRSMPAPITFPYYLYISENFFKTEWSLRTYRRLKNVTILMEWIPDLSEVTTLRQHANQPNGNGITRILSQEQLKLLKEGISFLDESGTASLKDETLREFMMALDVNVSGLDMKDEARWLTFHRSKAGSHAVTFPDIQVSRESFCQSEKYLPFLIFYPPSGNS